MKVVKILQEQSGRLQIESNCSTNNELLELLSSCITNLKTQTDEGIDSDDFVFNFVSIDLKSSIFQTKIKDFPFKANTVKLLTNAEIFNLENLVSKRDFELMKYRGIKTVAMNDIQKVLSEMGLRLEMSDKDMINFLRQNVKFDQLFKD